MDFWVGKPNEKIKIQNHLNITEISVILKTSITLFLSKECQMKKTILLVDDEIDILDIQNRYLLQAGYDVLSCP